MRVLVLALSCACGLVACSGAREPAQASASGSAAAVVPVAASAAASASQAGVPAIAAGGVKDANELFEFEYAWPAAAGAIPALRDEFDAEIAKEKSELAQTAREGRQAAKENGFEFHAYDYWKEWQVVTDLPGWLSLSANIHSYEGGAHPNSNFDSLIWDRQANRRRAAAELFASPAALSRAIRADFCREIDRQRKDKRGEEWEAGGSFTECIDPVENGSIILGSSNRKAFDRIGILVPPYNAGPYVEGSYEVTLPVTPAILAAVKPEYRATFAVKR